MKEARYFYVPEAPEANELPQDEAVHAIRVLRLKEGDEIFLMNGKGVFFRAEVSLSSNKRCMFKIIESIEQQPTWNGRIHLAMAPTKMMDRVEWMAEKVTEIGLDELSFLDCKFSERRQLRTDRIGKIVVSAVKQSRKAWMPVVNEMISFDDFIAKKSNGRRFICHCYEEIEKKDFFTEVSSLEDEQDVTVLVGPEGDFSIDEVKKALENGYESVSLGTSRLRTETAAVVAITMCNIARRK